jgi:Phosphoesterase family
LTGVAVGDAEAAGPPTSIAKIGHEDRANHQCDMRDFWAAARAGNLPAVSFLKAGGYQQGGGSTSSALDEQQFLVSLVNGLERLPSWRHTAVPFMYDDSASGSRTGPTTRSRARSPACSAFTVTAARRGSSSIRRRARRSLVSHDADIRVNAR